jgi:hypothetical protein
MRSTNLEAEDTCLSIVIQANLTAKRKSVALPIESLAASRLIHASDEAFEVPLLGEAPCTGRSASL